MKGNQIYCSHCRRKTTNNYIAYTTKGIKYLCYMCQLQYQKTDKLT